MSSWTKRCIRRYMKELNKKEYHPSMRGHFAGELYNQMVKNDKIFVVTADLGYGMFDKIRDDFPDRFINVGAAEQAAVGVAVGLALEEKIPVVYSITSFLLTRPYEWIRNYVDHERIPVKLIGGGRDKDYSHDGFTHFSEDAHKILAGFHGIEQMWPKDNEDVIDLMDKLINNGRPTFMSLKR